MLSTLLGCSKAPKNLLKEALKKAYFFMYSDRCRGEILTRSSQEVKTAKNITGNFRKSDNFSKRFRAPFNQLETFHKVLAKSIKFSKLQACLILNY